ncbi:MAG: LysM peptidoglycan-binding domain-containing protein [Candidatus Bathyarchaeota archaeon]|nr:LysM peptidoglycan-binding domain-containing protein [Candidatus Termiticorpusculum sp.]
MNILIKKGFVGLLVCVLILELMAICSATMPVEAASGPDAAPVDGIDYNIWTLDLPTGTILSSGDLKKQLYNSWWYPGTGVFKGYDMFQTPQRGAGEKAFGSPHTRCELREIIPSSGDRSGAWGTGACWGRLGYHKMVTEVKVERVNNNPRGDYATQSYTCIGQLWGESSGKSAMFSLMYIDAKTGQSSFRMLSADTRGIITYAPVHIPVGKEFTVTYECISGTLKVWVESKEANVAKTKIYDGPLASPADSNSYYFKVGNYDQSSDAKGDKVPDPKDVHTLVGFKSITVEHNPVKGRLTYANGNPVANQVIDYVLNGGGASNLKLSTKTDMDGYYYIANVPSNGGVTAASVSITVSTISGHKSDKTGTINIAAAATSGITGVRSSNTYNIVYTPTSQTTPTPTPQTTKQPTPTPQITKESTPSVSIDYVAEKLKGLNGAYAINGKTVNIVGDYTIDSSWFGTTISIIKKGSATTSDSVAQNLTIKSRPAAPSLSKTDCTTQQNNNGVITKVTSVMEYSTDNGVTWKAISGSSITELKPGTYYVRVKATSNAFKSNYATVTINSYSAPAVPKESNPPTTSATYYTVQAGDSLWSIGKKFNIAVDTIKKLNGLTSDMIYPKQQLQVSQNNENPQSTVQPNYITYTIKSGDTLWLLAQKYDTTVNNIKSLNGLTSDMIYLGQQLRIPT